MLCDKLTHVGLKIIAKIFPEIPVQPTIFVSRGIFSIQSTSARYSFIIKGTITLSSSFSEDVYGSYSFDLLVLQELTTEVTMLFSLQANIIFTVQYVHIINLQVGICDFLCVFLILPRRVHWN